MPIGSAISSQRTTPPKTSEPVTGAADLTTLLTELARTKEYPRFPFGRTNTGTPPTRTGTGLISSHMNFAYCT
jgi:hypothetical protein